MSYLYFAEVFFPASALALPGIQEDFDKAKHDYRQEAAVQGAMAWMSHTDASDGHIDVIDVLDANKVPYDHRHRDDNAMSEWTEHVRFDAQGTKIVYSTNPETNAQAAMASEILTLMMQNRFDEARTLLEAASTSPFVTLKEIADSVCAPAEVAPQAVSVPV